MSAHGGRRQAEHGEANAERWLLTYADMITLLLALFIVLFAFSSINVKKFLELRLGLTQAFNPSAIAEKGGSGLLNQTSLVDSPGSNSSRSPVLEPEQGNNSSGNGKTGPGGPSSSQIAQEIKVGLKDSSLANDASVVVDYQGVVVHIVADKVFFASDSATLGPIGNQIVDLIGTIVKPDPNGLMVEGFTDNVPVTGGQYKSNWELSAVRASNVVERLASVDEIQSNRLLAAGYGDTYPLVSNSTATGRGENRRVDVVILNTSTNSQDELPANTGNSGNTGGASNV